MKVINLKRIYLIKKNKNQSKVKIKLKEVNYQFQRENSQGIDRIIQKEK